MMDLNKNGVSFNFLKNLDIININNETEQLHPSTHEFWEEDEIRKSPMDYLVCWSRNPLAYAKEKLRSAQDEATNALKSDRNEENERMELGFVIGLFEMYKVRCDIAKARTELLSTSVLSGYRHKFGTFPFNSFICYRSSMIEDLIREKRDELDQYKKLKRPG